MAEQDKKKDDVTNPIFFTLGSGSFLGTSNMISGTTATSMVSNKVLSSNVLIDTQHGEFMLMHPDTQQTNVPVNFVEEKADAQEYYYYKAILEQISKLGEKQDVHDIRTTEDHKQLLKNMEMIVAENTYFRRQLAEINTPEKLEKYSISLGIFSIISIGISKIFNVDIVNPIFAYLMLGICAVFVVMTIIMNKQDKN